MALRMPIGVSDFSKLRTNLNNTYVDKSLFIRDIIDRGEEVTLITRPRRFGKTLNLSMLKYFFSCNEAHSAQLFDGLKIREAGEEYWQEQGQYPVIFITLKSVNGKDFATAYGKMAGLVAKCYREFAYLLTAEGILDENEKKFFQRITEETATQSEVEDSIHRLTRWLHKYHGKHTIVLFDEYDAPIHAGYFSEGKGYYQEMVDFMPEFLSNSLKDNNYLHKGIVTGILRVAKESIFSKFNNPGVFTFLDPEYAEYFGFTAQEVAELFSRLAVPVDLEKIKEWYNGYYVEDIVLYNPWSIISCLSRKGRTVPYWVNMSEDKLVRQIVTRNNASLQKHFSNLLQGKAVTAFINPHLNFNQLETDGAAALSLLYMSGYLNATCNPIAEGARKPVYTLRIPNKEVYCVYDDVITSWLSATTDDSWLRESLDALKTGKMEAFKEALQEIAYNILSYYDTGGRTPEQFYHGLLLGLVLYLHGEYTIRSNREAGTGRYDIALLPKDGNSNASGIIFELKRTDNSDDEHLTQVAEEALKQIEDRGYQHMAEAAHVTKWLHLGVAFSGKVVQMVYNKV
jgi:hypothetical protein